MANPWERDWSKPQGGQPQSQINVTPLPLSPSQAEEEERRRRADARAGGADARSADNDMATRIDRVASAYNADPAVRSYRVAITQLGQALGTGEGPQADLALTYAFAKAMDPDSVVRESEQGMITDSQPWVQSMVERTKKQFGMDGAGNYTPEARQALRMQISNAVAQRVKVYQARRSFYEKQAKALGIDPAVAIGEHDAKPFVPMIQEWVERSNNPAAAQQQGQGQQQAQENPWPGVVGQDGQPLPPEGGYGLDPQTGEWGMYGNQTDESPQQPQSNYQESMLGQGMSGVNEGIGNTLGLPVDAATGAMNAVGSGMNWVAQNLGGVPEEAALQPIENPVGGGQWFNDRMQDWGIYEPTNDTGGQVARRIGQSVGAAAVPLGGAANSARQAGAGLLAAAGGGAGAALSQQYLPGNAPAEFAAEMIGSGGTGLGMMAASRRQGQRAVERAVPTVQQLKDEAKELYRTAEGRGVLIPAAQTKRLRTEMQRTLREAGRVSPTGRISEVYPKAKEAMQLVQDYSGRVMTPTQLQVVRDVIADGLTSQEKSEQRIAGMLLDTFDAWAQPFAPELPAARDVASRYLQAETLEQARELAGAGAKAFSGSGFENALRTQYRGLDRGMIKGNQRFNEDVGQAIETVARGTPASNAARAAGRFAPTGVVSAGLGTGGPAALGFAMGGPQGALVAGTAAAAIGTAGRVAATQMGIRNAARAEMIARNGGNLRQVPLMDPEIERAMMLSAQGQLGQYVDPATAQQQEGANYPYPFAGTENKKRRRGLFGS